MTARYSLKEKGLHMADKAIRMWIYHSSNFFQIDMIKPKNCKCYLLISHDLARVAPNHQVPLDTTNSVVLPMKSSVVKDTREF